MRGTLQPVKGEPDKRADGEVERPKNDYRPSSALCARAADCAAGALLESIEMFDVYRGIQVGLGKKSVAFSLTFRAADRTLTDDEVQKAMEKVQAVCAEKYNAIRR